MTGRRLRFAGALIATSVASAAAAAPGPAALKPVLTVTVAHEVLAAAVAHARAVSAPGAAIAVVDDGGSVVALERLDGTFPAGPDISIGKARTAAAFRKPTRVFEDLVNKGRTAMLAVPAVTHFTPLQGGVPVVLAGQVVGAVGVSGAASAAQDDEIAQAGADAAEAAAAPAQASVFPGPRVAEAFRSGRALAATAAYSVTASRRDGPGVAEIHLRATDIFYVVAGHAELVTGGTVPGATPASADELRGTAIDGGSAQEIGPGDVVTIPAGVPHWFRRVDPPITYFTVKSTAGGG
jgi:glc operon protein GlcG